MALIKGKQIALNPDGIATGNLNDNAVTTVKIADAAVTTPKISITADLPMATFKITGLGDPTDAQDAATKFYVDANSQGLDLKASVVVATAAALAANTRSENVLTADAPGALGAVDGYSALSTNDRVLVKNEALGANNGIYVVTNLGSAGSPWVLTRSDDADLSSEVTPGMFCFVERGDTQADTGWVLITDAPIVLNTTSLDFTQFSGAGAYTAGQGIQRAGTVFSLATANTGLVFGGGTESTNTVSVNWGLDGEIVTIIPDAVAATGTVDKVAHIDHTHPIECAAPTVEVLTDAGTADEGVATSFMRSDARLLLSTAAPSANVISDAGTAAIGTATSALRSDAVLIATTASPVSVGATNAIGTGDELARAKHVHATPICTGAGQGQSPSVTTGDASTTGLTAGVINALAMVPEVYVNGMRYAVSNGSTGGSCYFSAPADAGATGLAYGSIVADSVLYWNGVQAGFELAASDSVDILINALA